MNKFISLSVFLAISLFNTFNNGASASDAVPAPQYAKSYSGSLDFFKTYKTSSENLFYLLLSALNENNYSIEEIQFKTGSVLFRAYTKEFIASTAALDTSNSFIKIVPADNSYNFSPLLIQKLHRYIDLNNHISFQRIL